jgi:NodT family efflux transporter outer membrane factor (OMF) lipoprotein
MRNLYKLKASATVSLSLALLGGCTVGPDFAGPDAASPASWHDKSVAGDHVTAEADSDPAWWLSFNDKELTSLIERATSGNPDVQIAIIRVAEARARQGVADAASLPKVSGLGAYTRLGAGSGLIPSVSGGASGSGSGASNLLDSLSKPVNLYAGTIDASWEIDLFGRVRRSMEAAGAESEAAIGNRDDALVTLEAEVAETYAELRAAQASRATAEADFATEQQVLTLTEARASNGLVSDLDVENAKTALAVTEASIAQYDHQIASAMNRLAVLVGAVPGTLDAELTESLPIPPPPPHVPLGLPASLAHRRPDIRVAEARLHEQTAEIGVATARFYPDIKLAGQAGLLGTHSEDLTRWANNFYELGPQISLPIFEGGQLQANLRLAKAEQAEAAVTYRKTVLDALEDVENALAAYRTELRRHDALERSVTAEETALGIARDQYTHGVANFISVLTAENALAQQHQALIGSTLALTSDVVTLYKALGGGWQQQTETADAGTK